MANLAEEFEIGEIIILLALVGLIICGIYYIAKNGTCEILGIGCNNVNPDNPSYVPSPSGSGQMTYTDAASISLSHPIDTLKSIFGID